MGAGAGGTVATGAGQGVMPPQVLGGPIWWLVMGLYLVTIALAAFVAIDAMRAARAPRFAEIWEPRLLYAIPCGVYLVCVLGVWIPAVPRVWSVLPVVLTPFALALCVAYLLRVVYPKPSAAAIEAAALASAAADAQDAASGAADEPQRAAAPDDETFLAD